MFSTFLSDFAVFNLQYDVIVTSASKRLILTVVMENKGELDSRGFANIHLSQDSADKCLNIFNIIPEV